MSSWVHFPLCKELRLNSLSLQTNSVQDIYFISLPYCKCLTSVWQNHKPFSIQFSVILNTAKENTPPNTPEPLEMISLPLWLGPQGCSVIHLCFPSWAFLSYPKWQFQIPPSFSHFWLVWLPLHSEHIILALNCPGLGASQVVLLVKNLPANAEDARGKSSIPESGRSLGGRNGYPLQFSCLENSVDRGAWQATAHGVTEESQLSDLAQNWQGQRRIPG